MAGVKAAQERVSYADLERWPEDGRRYELYKVTRHAPDLAIEILSPGTSRNDRGRKRRLLERHRVQEYWLVDPDALVHTIWMASDRSDRVGMRLEGRPLRYRSPDRVLPSEGATRGAIQVPANGLPVILGPDHPVTGGYPVVGVIADEDIDKVAQVRPGQYVRLHWSRPRVALAAASGSAAAQHPTW